MELLSVSASTEITVDIQMQMSFVPWRFRFWSTYRPFYHLPIFHLPSDDLFLNRRSVDRMAEPPRPKDAGHKIPGDTVPLRLRFEPPLCDEALVFGKISRMKSFAEHILSSYLCGPKKGIIRRVLQAFHKFQTCENMLPYNTCINIYIVRVEWFLGMLSLLQY